MNRDPWWTTAGPALATLAFPATILVLLVLAAAADAPIFALVAGLGTVVVLVVRWRRRRPNRG